MFKDSPEGQTQYEPAAPEPVWTCEWCGTAYKSSDEYTKCKRGKGNTAALAGIEPIGEVRPNAVEGYSDNVTMFIEIAVATKLYSAADVERLVQERDEAVASRTSMMHRHIDTVQQLAAMTQERDMHAKVADARFEYLQIARSELAAMTKERDGAKTLAIYYSEQFATSQAREQQLREALEYVGKEISEGQGVCIETVVEALSFPQDDTALRQWGAKLLREIADLGHGDWREVLRRKADKLEGKK